MMQYDHEKFKKLFQDRAEFLFHPEESVIPHYIRLEKDIYTKECVIGWLEHADTPKTFTKQECYEAIGLRKANRAFNKFWRFLTAPRRYDHHICCMTKKLKLGAFFHEKCTKIKITATDKSSSYCCGQNGSKIMNAFNKVVTIMNSSKVDYGHIQNNRKNIQTLIVAKKEIEKALYKKEKDATSDR